MLGQRKVDEKSNEITAIPKLRAGIQDSFRMRAAEALDEQVDGGHGRVETRIGSVLADPSLLEKPSERAALKGLVRIQAERYHKASDKTETEIRYYITSLAPDAARLNRCIRQHWGNRKQTALGAARRLRRRPGQKTRRPRRPELLPAQPHRT